jgi:hypothetical protein
MRGSVWQNSLLATVNSSTWNLTVSLILQTQYLQNLISPTFYEQLLRQNLFAKKITNPNCKLIKLRKKLLYEKTARKILVKLTRGLQHVLRDINCHILMLSVCKWERLMQMQARANPTKLFTSVNLQIFIII